MANHMTAEKLRAGLVAAAEQWKRAAAAAEESGDSEVWMLCLRAAGQLNEVVARLSGMAAGWQPIETAPKDGKDYIASDGRLRTLENQPQGCMPGRWSKGPDGKWSGYANRPIGYAPKYWHPLPAAPEPPHV